MQKTVLYEGGLQHGFSCVMGAVVDYTLLSTGVRKLNTLFTLTTAKPFGRAFGLQNAMERI